MNFSSILDKDLLFFSWACHIMPTLFVFLISACDLLQGTYSTQIFSLAVLLSSMFVYNQVGLIHEVILLGAFSGCL